jgi:hypothetical protein
MSSSLLELIRLNHELSERTELAIGEELDVKPNGVSIPLLVADHIQVLTLYSSIAKGEGMAATQVETTNSTNY